MYGHVKMQYQIKLRNAYKKIIADCHHTNRKYQFNIVSKLPWILVHAAIQHRWMVVVQNTGHFPR